MKLYLILLYFYNYFTQTYLSFFFFFKLVQIFAMHRAVKLVNWHETKAAKLPLVVHNW